MKTNIEIAYYQRLRAKMMVKAELLKVNWARYYANLLNLGGVHNEQYLKNYFNDDNKKLSSEHLTTILMDLENFTDVRPINQDQLKDEVLRIVGGIGSLTDVIRKELDSDNNISHAEVMKLIPKVRSILVLAEELHIRLEETKASQIGGY